ncbi:MAG: hypothetical protein KDJ65_02270 [Anaerolineae bacterium]|nr:hypothetical protein [Anaerolineae bacterium]
MKTLATALATITDIILVVVIGYGLWLWAFSGGINPNTQQFYINITLATTAIVLLTIGMGIAATIKMKS